MGQSWLGRGRGARPGEGRRGQIRGGEAAAKETGRSCFHLEGFCSGFWMPESPHITETRSRGTLACGGRGEPC